ncbi:MAG: glycosyltransferase family 2 protein [Kangiellaceae bacterium]|nr:glycosyltransferase family 2 protein [Kangiellaceae bacterium]
MAKVSVIMPVYNMEKYVKASVQSVLNQSYRDFELIVVDDGSSDSSVKICLSMKDPRIRILRQKNRGLAGARNTGIRFAKGEYIAFLDSDDLWAKDKLAWHVDHLDNKSRVGVSFSQSSLIDEEGIPLGIAQLPKLKDINFKDIICRNPIGNGSAPVIRKSVLERSSYCRYHKGVAEVQYFDEEFRQSEDIEFWLRIAIHSELRFEGIAKCLTYYRINDSGLSANLSKQLNSWQQAMDKLALMAPKRIYRWKKLAGAYQLRYLARRAVRNQQPSLALKLIMRALTTDRSILIEEPKKTVETFLSSLLLSVLPKFIYSAIESSYLFFARYSSPTR